MGDPEATLAVCARALDQWRDRAAEFPGNAPTRILGPGETRREDFFDTFADVSCPALDPVKGTRLLYAWRPLSCRSFGLPVRYGSHTLPPCSLNFTAATEEEIAGAAVEPDPGDHEGELLAEGVRCGALAAETIVCAVLALAGGRLSLHKTSEENSFSAP